jgi:hypothetical protein
MIDRIQLVTAGYRNRVSGEYRPVRKTRKPVLRRIASIAGTATMAGIASMVDAAMVHRGLSMPPRTASSTHLLHLRTDRP